MEYSFAFKEKNLTYILMANKYDSLTSACAEEFNLLPEEQRRIHIVVEGGTYWERFSFAFSLVPKVKVGVSTRDASPSCNGEYVVSVEDYLPKYQVAS